jgi:hypothetical protein
MTPESPHGAQWSAEVAREMDDRIDAWLRRRFAAPQTPWRQIGTLRKRIYSAGTRPLRRLCPEQSIWRRGHGN